jgi:hypothetical protein
MNLLLSLALAACIAFSSASGAAAPPKTASYEMVANGEVQIDAVGHVSDYKLSSELTPEISALVDRSVRRWRFEPILQDGRPVTAKTALRIRLLARRSGVDSDNFTVSIASVDFSAPRRSSAGKPPRYPQLAASARLNAKVLLLLRIDDTGKVVEALPYQTSLGARTRSERDAESWRTIFERASITAAKTWKYDLTEMLGDQRVGGYSIAPIEFRIVARDAGSDHDQWTGYIPGPVHQLPEDLRHEIEATDRASRLADGEAAALNSRFRLVDDVVGKVL